ncbi:MAG: hypothetical protein Q8N05_20935 [Bacteroidota bacterium]|nr:hypothetical protein [Bacteroidota bacterium]
MKLLKKIGFFIVFFVTLSQTMGNSTFRFEEKLFVVDNHENEQPANESFSIEFDEIEDENLENTAVTCICVSIIEQSIVEKECHFDSSFNFTFWQPPKKF